MDRLRAYEVFSTVVAKASFARAAEALDTSPANVTRYVSELEAHLGTRLLNRSTRRLSLTESGAALVERCRAILDEVAEAEAIASTSAVQPRGRLRINAGVTFGIRHLASLWPAFMARYPDIALEVDLIDRVVDIVDEGYDLAIRASAAPVPATMVARKLATSRIVVCAAPAYLKKHGTPKQPGELAKHTCLGFSYAVVGDDWQFTDPTGRAVRVKVRFGFHTNNGDTLREVALAGHGVIRVSTFLVGDDLHAGRLVQLLPTYALPDTDIIALYPSRRHLSGKVRAMVEFLREAFADGAPWESRKRR